MTPRARLRALSAGTAQPTGAARSPAQSPRFFSEYPSTPQVQSSLQAWPTGAWPTPPPGYASDANAAQFALRGNEAAQRAINKKRQEQLTQFSIVGPHMAPLDAVTHLYAAALALECSETDRNTVAAFVRSLIPNETVQTMMDGAPPGTMDNFAGIARRYLALRGVGAAEINAAVYKEGDRRAYESVEQHATRFGMLTRIANIDHHAALDQYRRAVTNGAAWTAERLARKEAEAMTNALPTISSISILVAQLDSEAARERAIAHLHDERRTATINAVAPASPQANRPPQRKSNKRERSLAPDTDTPNPSCPTCRLIHRNHANCIFAPSQSSRHAKALAAGHTIFSANPAHKLGGATIVDEGLYVGKLMRAGRDKKSKSEGISETTKTGSDAYVCSFAPHNCCPSITAQIVGTNVPFTTLVDSGASHSIIAQHLVPAGALAAMAASHIKEARGFNNAPTAIHGAVELQLTLLGPAGQQTNTENPTLTARFLVVSELAANAILGIDSITAAGMVIDGRAGTVTCESTSWPIQPTTLEAAAVNDLRAIQGGTGANVTTLYDITCGRGTTTMVLCKVDVANCPPPGTAMSMRLRPVALFKKTLEKKADLAAKVLVAEDDNVACVRTVNLEPTWTAMILVENTTDEDTHVKAGTVVASAHYTHNVTRIFRIAVNGDDLTDADQSGWTDADKGAYAKANDVSPPDINDFSEDRLRAAVAKAAKAAHDDGRDDVQTAQLLALLEDEVVPMGFDPTNPAVRAADVPPITIRLKPDAQPSAAPRRITSEAGERFKKETEEGMLRMGIIEPCQFSSWASPVHLAKRKDGSFRYTVDMRALNQAVVKFSYPLPTCQELIDHLAGAKFFTTLDAKSGYWQFPLDEASRPLTAFRAPGALYQWTRLPMGLIISSAEFQQRIEAILGDLVRNGCLCYVDDIIIYAETWTEHLSKLQQVLQRLREARITINMEKSFFGREYVTYLGFIIGNGTIAPDKRLVEKIVATQAPLTFNEARSFLGQTVLYRRFMYHYGDKCKPIRDAIQLATSKKHKEIKGLFVWTNECTSALGELKSALTSHPLHRLPDPKRPYHLFTDASGYAAGCVLCQTDSAGEFYTVLYDSLALPKAARSWSTSEKETFALVFFLHKYDHLIDNNLPITAYTDHAAVKSCLERPSANAKLTRWGLSLAQYSNVLKIVHWSGDKQLADFMSRHPDHAKAAIDPNGECLRIKFVSVPNDAPFECAAETATTPTVAPPTIAAVTTAIASDPKPATDADADTPAFLGWTDAAIAKLQRDCPGIGVFTQATDGDIAAQRALGAAWQKGNFSLVNGVLFRTEPNTDHTELVVPEGLRYMVLAQAHESVVGGHAKGDKLLQRLVGRFWWPRRAGDATEWHTTCDACQLFARPTHKPHGLLQSLLVDEPFALMGMDIIGPLPCSSKGNKYILTCTDYFSRWLEAIPIADKAAATVARAFMTNVVCRWGAPTKVISDCGKEFCNTVFDTVSLMLGTGHMKTSPYHPQADGMAERSNGKLLSKLGKYVRYNQTDWDTFVPFVAFSLNSETHSVIGMSPFRAITGMKPRLPVETMLPSAAPRKVADREALEVLRDQARVIAHTNDQRRIESTQKANSKRKTSPINVGDTVTRRVAALSRDTSQGKRTAKLAKTFNGPFIVQKLHGTRATLTAPSNPNRRVEANVQELELFKEPNKTLRYVEAIAPSNRTNNNNILNDKEWTVEGIRAHRDHPATKERSYNVAWENFDSKRCHTWEKASSLGIDSPLVREYERNLLLAASATNAPSNKNNNYNDTAPATHGLGDPNSAKATGKLYPSTPTEHGHTDAADASEGRSPSEDAQADADANHSPVAEGHLGDDELIVEIPLITEDSTRGSAKGRRTSGKRSRTEPARKSAGSRDEAVRRSTRKRIARRR